MKPPPPVDAIRQLLARRSVREALEAAKLASAEWPDNAEVHLLQGIAEAELGLLSDAKTSILRALAMAPNRPWTWELVLVNLLRDSGDLANAKEAGERLALRVPERAEAHNALGLTLRALQVNTESIDSFRRAIAANPNYVAAYVNAASALVASEAYQSAITLLQQGVRVNPSSHELHVELGKTFDALRQPASARAAYGAALRLSPRGSFHALHRFGRIAYEEADIFSAINAYEVALELEPKDIELWIWLGNAYLDVGAIAQATRCFDEALKLKPDYSEVYDNLLICHHYNPNVGPERMYETHLEWQRRFAPKQGAGTRSNQPAAGRSRKVVRVGFVSHSMHRGAVPYFLQPLLRYLDRERFTVHCYNVGPTASPSALHVDSLRDKWRDMGGISDEELFHAIRDDHLDVLIDLDGHVPGNRLRALARKPAPVQITWLDYFDTTGTSAFDFLISDSVSTPPGGSQLFTEQVIRLDPCRLCYSPPAYAPEPVSPPVLRNGLVTFGSFNRLSKLAEPLLDQWTALLRGVPGSRLILKNSAFAHRTTRDVFAQRFALRGVDAHRIELRGPSEHAQMLSEYRDVDIALDTFPYNGGLTTCEALLMGLPIVAMAGQSMISQQTAALLTAAGFPQWIAGSASEWLSLNVAIAGEAAGLRDWRQQARTVLARTPLMDEPAFARKFSAMILECLR